MVNGLRKHKGLLESNRGVLMRRGLLGPAATNFPSKGREREKGRGGRERTAGKEGLVLTDLL